MRAARLISLVLCLGMIASANAGDVLLTCPPGLEIFLDGTRAGMCESAANGKRLTELSAGNHTVRIEKNGFLPAEFLVVVGVISQQIVVGELSPRPTFSVEGGTSTNKDEKPVGRIEVTSVPVDCTLRIGNRWTEKEEPLVTILDVPAGEHNLWFERFGALLQTKVVVTPDAPARIKVDFANKRVTTGSEEPTSEGGGSSNAASGPAGESPCLWYWVQVLRTSDLKLVETTQTELDELGFPLLQQEVITVEDDGVLPLYKLRIGPMKDMYTAKLVMHKLLPTKIIETRILSEPCRQQP